MNAERTFYIDNENGDDTRTGLSPEAAWKTLERANRQEFQPGDALRLKRGGSWHGMLCPQRIRKPGMSHNGGRLWGDGRNG